MHRSVILKRSFSCVWTGHYILNAMQIIGGAIFLSVCAQISIPLYPVPITMQTLGVFILAITQSQKIASSSVISYLILVSLGLPVLVNGDCQALWYLRPTAGYLLGLPIAAYIIGAFLSNHRDHPSVARLVLSMCCAKIVVYGLGVLVLTRMLPVSTSLAVGLVPFIPVSIVKIIMATSFGKVWLHWKSRSSHHLSSS